MEYRTLGRTGLQVSVLSLGTVEFGVEYGIKKPGQSNLPTRDDAITLIRYAADQGINLFDTAPGYGISEELLGEAIGDRPDCYIATKVTLPKDSDQGVRKELLKERIKGSIENSLRALHRDVLDIVQIHNATEEDMHRTAVAGILKELQASGKIHFLGASVYGEKNARAVVESGSFDVIQLAYSILDQRMADHIFSLTDEAHVGILNRSAFLKGVLTPRAKWLPDELGELRAAAGKIVDQCKISWEQLPGLALRFCFSTDAIDTVLVGTASRDELDRAMEAERKGRVTKEEFDTMKEYALTDEVLLNPVHWPEM